MLVFAHVCVCMYHVVYMSVIVSVTVQVCGGYLCMCIHGEVGCLILRQGSVINMEITEWQLAGE